MRKYFGNDSIASSPLYSDPLIENHVRALKRIEFIRRLNQDKMNAIIEFRKKYHITYQWKEGIRKRFEYLIAQDFNSLYSSFERKKLKLVAPSFCKAPNTTKKILRRVYLHTSKYFDDEYDLTDFLESGDIIEFYKGVRGNHKDNNGAFSRLKIIEIAPSVEKNLHLFFKNPKEERLVLIDDLVKDIGKNTKLNKIAKREIKYDNHRRGFLQYLGQTIMKDILLLQGMAIDFYLRYGLGMGHSHKDKVVGKIDKADGLISFCNYNKEKFHFNNKKGILTVEGEMTNNEKEKLMGLCSSKKGKEAIEGLFERSQDLITVDRQLFDEDIRRLGKKLEIGKEYGWLDKLSPTVKKYVCNVITKEYVFNVEGIIEKKELLRFYKILPNNHPHRIRENIGQPNGLYLPFKEFNGADRNTFMALCGMVYDLHEKLFKNKRMKAETIISYANMYLIKYIECCTEAKIAEYAGKTKLDAEYVDKTVDYVKSGIKRIKRAYHLFAPKKSNKSFSNNQI